PVRRRKLVADADGNGLLALALVHGARDFAGEEQRVDALLKAADEQHAAVQLELMVHPDYALPLPPYSRISSPTSSRIWAWPRARRSSGLCDPRTACGSGTSARSRTASRTPRRKAAFNLVPTLNLATPRAIAAPIRFD